MSSIDAAALFWRPPSPYEYTLAREIMRLSMRHMSHDEYQLVKTLLLECDDDGEYLASMDGESVRELLSGVRKTVRWWLEGEPDDAKASTFEKSNGKALWTDWAKHREVTKKKKRKKRRK